MNPEVFPSLEIPLSLHQEISLHMHKNLPDEACGLLAGVNHKVLKWIPVTNILQSPLRYRMDAQEQLDALLSIEKNGLQLLAIVHSHPSGPPHPSQTDIKEAYYPESAYLIYYFENNHWQVNGFKIIDGEVFPIKIRLTE